MNRRWKCVRLNECQARAESPIIYSQVDGFPLDFDVWRTSTISSSVDWCRLTPSLCRCRSRLPDAGVIRLEQKDIQNEIWRTRVLSYVILVIRIFLQVCAVFFPFF